MKKFLFVCLGNVGRSQMAEAFYNSITNSTDSWSAGIQADTPKKYGSPIKRIIDVMKEFNIDISKAKVKNINQDIIDASENIVIMCEKNECPDFLLKTNKNIFWGGIKDPAEMSYDNTKIVRNQIKQKVLTLIE